MCYPRAIAKMEMEMGSNTGKKLTPKMLAFCDCVALEGMNLSAAYRSAYNAENMSMAAVNTEASLLGSNPAITKRIETLRARRERALVGSSISDASLVRQKLREWIEVPVDTSRLKAAELLGRASGVFIDRLETSTVDRTPDEIADELAQRLEDALDKANASPAKLLTTNDDDPVESVESQPDDDHPLH